MKLHPRLLSAEATPLYELIRTSKSVMVVFDAGHGLVGLMVGRTEGDKIVVPFTDDDTVTFAFDKNTSDPELQDHNLKMLAWREWEGAWHVLDPRVSMLLHTLDNYAEGDAS